MLMDLMVALVIGVLQGLLEWLPVSSSGHIMLVLTYVFNLSLSSSFKFSMIAHLGTVFSAIIYFRREVLLAVKSFLNLNFREKYLGFIFLTTLFSLVTGLPIYLFLKTTLEEFSLDVFTLLFSLLLLFTGVVLFLSRRREKGKRFSDLCLRDMIVLGLAQGFSVLPGVSRSGITTGVLMLRGYSPEASLKASFLASILVVLGVSLLELASTTGIKADIPVIVVLFSSFLTSIFTITFLMKIARRLDFTKFLILYGLAGVLLSIFIHV